jgi:pimeloyl-ACP methyl ester carboxylesterase
LKHILYIPGLGDNGSLNSQRMMLSLWSTKKGKIHFFDPKWHDADENYDQKYERLVELGSRLKLGENDQLIVIGISAGGSLAVRYVLENDSVYSAYLVCAKLTGPSAIGRAYQDRSPALLQSVQHSDRLLSGAVHKNSAKITTLRPLIDGIVPLHDMLVPGSKRVRMLTIGHTVSIVYSLLVDLRFRI